MKRKRAVKKSLCILSLAIMAGVFCEGGFACFTDYQSRTLSAKSGVALEVSAASGISAVNQNGYKLKKGAAGWYAKDSEALVQANVAKGYTFSGWYEGVRKTADTTQTAIRMTAPLKLTAKANINNYTISYNLNGGAVSGNPTSYTVETPTFVLKNPTRSGYTFTGWSGSGGTEVQTSVSITKGSTGNKSYTANWRLNKLTCVYHGNGATYAMKNGAVVSNPANYTFTTVRDYGVTEPYGFFDLNNKEYIYLERAGYTPTYNWVSGSYKVNQGENNLTTQQMAAKFGKDLSKGDVTLDLYAQWRINVLYLNYYGNGATSGSYKGAALSSPGGLVYSNTLNYGAVQASGLANYNSTTYLILYRSGYTRTGYWTSGNYKMHMDTENTSAQSIAGNFGKDLSKGDVTLKLYAGWSKNKSLENCEEENTVSEEEENEETNTISNVPDDAVLDVSD